MQLPSSNLLTMASSRSGSGSGSDQLQLSSLSFQSPPTNTYRWWRRWEMVAIVTGGNKGIGYAVVKKLSEMGVRVILTARDEERGRKAVDSLHQLGHKHVQFHCLDIADPISISSFTAWFQLHFHPTLDILVNNAGVSFNEIEENSVEHAETVMNTNYYGSKLLTESLLPLFRPNSPYLNRILNITSRLGSFDKVKNPNIKEMLEEKERVLSEEAIEDMVSLFLDNVKRGTWETQGWPKMWTDYAVSKLAINAYSVVLARKYEGNGVRVNCFCPGFTQTSMTGGKGNHTADDAADMAAKILLLPPTQLPNGYFYLASSTGGVTLISSKL